MKVSFHKSTFEGFKRKPKRQVFKAMTVYAWGYWLLVIKK